MFHDVRLTECTILTLRARYEAARERIVGCKLKEFDELGPEEQKFYFPRLMSGGGLPFRL